MSVQTQQEGPSKRFGNRKKTMFMIALAAILTAGAVVIYQLVSPLSAKEAQVEAVYKETAVTRGDLTVGITESGVTTLETLTHTFSVATTVDEVLIKAGQYVQEGDVLVKLDPTDIQEKLTELQSSYRTANVKYQEQLLQQKLTQVNAEATLQETLARSDTAGMEYELSLDEQDLSVISAKSNVKTIQDSIDYYTDLLGGADEETLREKYARQ